MRKEGENDRKKEKEKGDNKTKQNKKNRMVNKSIEKAKYKRIEYC
jgi:hypothetical protein